MSRGRPSFKHGTCSHQWANGEPCLRCGMVQGGRRPIRQAPQGRGAGRPEFEDVVPQCVQAPLRRSFLERIAAPFARIGGVLRGRGKP